MHREEQLCRVWIVGFAGHRVVKDPAAIKGEISSAMREIRNGVEGKLIGRSSAAAGTDLLFLEACRELGIPYTVVLPFAEDRFSKDFDDPDEWNRATTQLAGAAYVELAPGNESEPEAYHLAAREVIDVSDVILFVWDGEPVRGIGGTAETVTEARERGMTHQIIDAKTSSVGPMVNGRPFPWRDKVFAALPAVREVDQLFDELDRRAVQGAPLYRWFHAGSITLNQLAPVLYAALIAFSLIPELAPVVRFLLVFTAACLPWIGVRCRINNDWVDHRIRAELLRSLRASHVFSPAFRPFAEELFDAEMPFLRSIAWRMIGRSQDWKQERDRYINERLNGQIEYLQGKASIAARRLRVLKITFRISSVGALLFGASAILSGYYQWALPDLVDQVFMKLLPLSLPAVAAWCLAMISVFEHKRRAELYRLLVKRLRLIRSDLVEAKSRTSAASAVSSCERLLLTELWEWSGTHGRRS